MKLLTANCPDHALYLALLNIKTRGVIVDDGKAATLTFPHPVCTIYPNPINRVSFSPIRDANPFFHFMESMWILARRKDVKFLNEFNSNMKNFSDDGEVFNAPYGHRLGSQLDEVIMILKSNPNSRQAVAQIWDKEDLTKVTKDKACNLQLIFRLVEGRLNMTVTNRSNDIVWGAYGANVVQFSTILEYVAASVGVPMGIYYQFSNDLHIYLEGPSEGLVRKLVDNVDLTYGNECTYPDPSDFTPEGLEGDRVEFNTYTMAEFNADLVNFFRYYDKGGLSYAVTESGSNHRSAYFGFLVLPMVSAWIFHKSKLTEDAVTVCDQIYDSHWKLACANWLTRRLNK